MATFPNIHSNCIAHSARKLNTFYFRCTILEAQCNHKHVIILSSYVQIMANLQGFRKNMAVVAILIWLFNYYFFVYAYIEGLTSNTTLNTFTLYLMCITRTHV